VLFCLYRIHIQFGRSYIGHRKTVDPKGRKCRISVVCVSVESVIAATVFSDVHLEYVVATKNKLYFSVIYFLQYNVIGTL
jgi:hypothetical protein